MNVYMRIEGHIIGFDEYMNLVLDEAREVSLRMNTEKSLGRILLRGENVTLIQAKQGAPKTCCAEKS